MVKSKVEKALYMREYWKHKKQQLQVDLGPSNADQVDPPIQIDTEDAQPTLLVEEVQPGGVVQVMEDA